jgi:glyoxylase-like metal-dependent hydrolase (beta-lactamase superfamily II)
MCEEILPELFRIKIPLPASPLKYLNSYVIRDPDRSLIIDTGLNRKECLEAMLAGLGKLAVDLNRSDVFITHLHADHFGLVTKLVTDATMIYFSRPDKEIIESWEGFEPMIAFAGRNGFPQEELRAAVAQHPAHKYGSDWIPELSILEDGDQIHYGQYRFNCVATPGHTMGHICLYESEKKILVAGDHILIDITPNIQCWSNEQNPLKYYLASLDKVNQLEIDLTLPGHRRLIQNTRERIRELKNHHAGRLEEVLSILNPDPMNAYQIASQMTWDLDCESWHRFPVAQKWFATGEALSHLRYLEEEGRVSRSAEKQVTKYTLCK